MFNQTRLMAFSSIAALLACSMVFAAENPANTKPKETKPNVEQTQEITQDDIKKASEAFGHFIGRNLNTPAIKFDLDRIIQGMRDGMAGKPAPMSDKDYEALMMRIQKKAFENLSAANLKAADEFMSKNAKEQGVIELEPGKLQYMIITKGNGPTVEQHATPSINYVGKYLDGTVFGNSEDAGGPINIPLDQTIPGFSKGIVGMKEGEKRRLFVHPTMGYGTMGHLPPNSLLIFDIEVVKADTPKEAMNEDDEDDLLPLALDDEDFEDDDEDDEDEIEKKADETKKPAAPSPAPSPSASTSNSTKFNTKK